MRQAGRKPSSMTLRNYVRKLAMFKENRTHQHIKEIPSKRYFGIVIDKVYE